ncbi:MAG: hypothetical protein JJ921_05165 [Pseudomonadales bacterium]|nr:hypothetical protein [Pseudomonadales bacterium]MBO6701708.1 hypothetical protein [Pseudomonadales bacterium]MBO7006648.1 hypothetical protein [Pseudomonadales bacterium]
MSIAILANATVVAFLVTAVFSKMVVMRQWRKLIGAFLALLIGEIALFSLEHELIGAAIRGGFVWLICICGTFIMGKHLRKEQEE